MTQSDQLCHICSCTPHLLWCALRCTDSSLNARGSCIKTGLATPRKRALACCNALLTWRRHQVVRQCGPGNGIQCTRRIYIKQRTPRPVSNVKDHLIPGKSSMHQPAIHPAGVILPLHRVARGSFTRYIPWPMQWTPKACLAVRHSDKLSCRMLMQPRTQPAAAAAAAAAVVSAVEEKDVDHDDMIMTKSLTSWYFWLFSELLWSRMRPTGGRRPKYLHMHCQGNCRMAFGRACCSSRFIAVKPREGRSCSKTAYLLRLAGRHANA